MLRAWGIAAAFAAAALPAAAQQALPAPDSRPVTAPLMLLPQPTEIGEPVIAGPQASAEADRERRLGCATQPCRLRLVGVLDKNGGVALQATAFTW